MQLPQKAKLLLPWSVFEYFMGHVNYKGRYDKCSLLITPNLVNGVSQCLSIILISPLFREWDQKREVVIGQLLECMYCYAREQSHWIY